MKVLSSREGADFANRELLQGLVFVLFDQLEIEDEPSNNASLLLQQLEEGVIALAESHENAVIAYSALAHDAINLEVNNAILLSALKKTSELLESLRSDAQHKDALSLSLDALNREAENLDIGARDALANAIRVYNTSVIDAVMSGKIP